MLVRVLRIPRQFPDGFRFGHPQVLTFVEYDWFRADSHDISTPEGRKKLEDFIKGKRYYSDKEGWLILAGEHSFTINYEAP